MHITRQKLSTDLEIQGERTHRSGSSRTGRRRPRHPVEVHRVGPALFIDSAIDQAGYVDRPVFLQPHPVLCKQTLTVRERGRGRQK